jgi:hypothetical protein
MAKVNQYKKYSNKLNKIEFWIPKTEILIKNLRRANIISKLHGN